METKSFKYLVQFISPNLKVTTLDYFCGTRVTFSTLTRCAFPSPQLILSVSENTDATIPKRSFISAETVNKLSFHVVARLL